MRIPSNYQVVWCGFWRFTVLLNAYFDALPGRLMRFWTLYQGCEMPAILSRMSCISTRWKSNRTRTNNRSCSAPPRRKSTCDISRTLITWVVLNPSADLLLYLITLQSLRCHNYVRWSPIWGIWAWGVWRLPGRWSDGGRENIAARWTRWRAAPAYVPTPDLTLLYDKYWLQNIGYAVVRSNFKNMLHEGVYGEAVPW